MLNHYNKEKPFSWLCESPGEILIGILFYCFLFEEQGLWKGLAKRKCKPIHFPLNIDSPGPAVNPPCSKNKNKNKKAQIKGQNPPYLLSLGDQMLLGVQEPQRDPVNPSKQYGNQHFCPELPTILLLLHFSSLRDVYHTLHIRVNCIGV